MSEPERVLSTIMVTRPCATANVSAVADVPPWILAKALILDPSVDAGRLINLPATRSFVQPVTIFKVEPVRMNVPFDLNGSSFLIPK
jgi:hypothetical protein